MIKTILFLILSTKLAFGFQAAAAAPAFKNIQESFAKHASSLSATAFAPVLMSAAIVNRDLSDDLCDPFAEGSICGDLGDVAMGLTGLHKSAVSSSAMAVVGRALAFSANFLPHHAAHPEQLLCQSVLLLTAVHGLAKTVERETSSAPASIREGRAFKAFFGPAGLSWSQFKSVSSNAIDFVSFEEGEVVSDEDDSEYLYWLYSGEVEVESTSSTFKVARGSSVPRSSDGAEPCKMGLWGDMKFARMLRGQKTSMPRSSLRAVGSAGATMVRIHAPTLQKMMAEDSALSSSMESVLFRSVHNKALAL